MKKPAAIWLRIFAAGFIVISALLVLTLLTQIPYGDLARLGRVSDREFGWRAPAPQVSRQWLQAYTPAEADVLVIGDSFSMTGRWQSRLAQEGLKVSTIYWGHFGEAVCADFDRWVADGGFRGKLIIIESVERLLRERMARSATCESARRPMRKTVTEYLDPPQMPTHFEPYWSATLMNGWITWQNTRRARQAEGPVEVDLNIRVRPVQDGCKLFSHRLCEKALFYGDDDDNGELGPEQVQAMQAFQQRHAAIPILWMIVPNKTTVYALPAHSSSFVDAFKAAGLDPDLFGFAQAQKRQIRDFYFPNDTHMSMHGQLAMGDLMVQAARKLVPPTQAARP